MNRTLRVGRAATFAYFTLNGLLLGMWVVHIPAVQDRTGVGHAALGWLLLLLGAGAFVGMQMAGPLADRFGPRRAVPVSAVLCALGLALPALAGDAWGLGVGLLLFGFGNGCLDVTMNAHAVQVERGYGRPVMSAFHALFSVGGVLAALAGAAVLARGWAPGRTLPVVALAGVLIALACAPALLKTDPARSAVLPPPAEGAESALARPEAGSGHGTDLAAEPAGAGAEAVGGLAVKVGAGEKARRDPGPSRRVWALGGLALLLMLCEGVANDWSALHLRDVLGSSDGVAALAYGAFSTAMTAGRLCADRVAARFGTVFVLRWGSVLAAGGWMVVVLSPWAGLALLGWTVAGLGLSGCVPQLFSAAGHVDPAAAGANVSRVAGLGYLGMLAGPAIIGPLTNFVPLNVAFLLPALFCGAAVAAARIARPTPLPSASLRPA
ncbi:MFS transporter [Actinocorallia herbida]|uniref:MFS transporter n=1 Tax=Actinocorallia herbida TaxID=58109 RepID=A0A3N1D6Q2_9ACTN|nr:MFS transporter [Actinocorallia herbida]ROO89194.1 MFS transporter [Actinocorallia herbida]